MAIAMDKCMARVGVRDARGDVKATTIKKKKKKKKKMSNVYEDVPKPKSNLDLCPVLGRVMLDPLQSRSLLAPFSEYKVEH